MSSFPLAHVRSAVLFAWIGACAPDRTSLANDTSDDSAGPPVCPTLGDGKALGQLASGDIREASGLVASSANTGTLWVNNDSGDTARLFAISEAGALRGIFKVTGANAQDWEDVALGVGTDRDFLYAGDIGDNDRARGEVQVYRFPEPNVATEDAVTAVETFHFTYPDGAHDVETLLVDPLTADLYIVTKEWDGNSKVFRAASPLVDGETRSLEPVATLAFGSEALPGATLATAGDVSRDGREIVVRTYTSAFVFLRDPAAPLYKAFGGTPCPVPLAEEGQGEAIGFRPDGKGYYTVSEGKHATVYGYAPVE